MEARSGWKMSTNRKSRWMWLAGAIFLGLSVWTLSSDLITGLRLRLMDVDVIPLRAEGKVNIGFRCLDKNASAAIDLVEGYLDRQNLAIDTVFVHDPVGDRGLGKICRMKRMSKIAGLSIYSRTISSNGLKFIEVAKEATRLVLQCPKVDCDGIPHIVRMVSLKRVDLTASCVDDRCLGSLAKLPALEILCLTETPISANAICEFEKERPDVGVVH
jgi:hypothetical protein